MFVTSAKMCALALTLTMAATGVAWSQDAGDTAANDTTATNPAAPPHNPRMLPAPIQIGHFRPLDARGLNMFEPPKEEGVPYTGFALQWGAAFTQQFQALDHSNTATPVIAGTPPVNVNQLVDIGPGFNNADANLYLNAQLGKGVRVAMTSYLSSRHHNETWVKDGYLLVDGSPWENAMLDDLFKILTLRLGHFEINYGDAHFRRSDNGQAMFNPFVGNNLMDAFTTEIGGEVYARKNGVLAMVAVTGGEVRGTVLKPDARSPAFMGKLGIDRQVSPALRTRLTGSVYTTTGSINNTLYTGSRAGSRFYWVGENTLATETGNAWSGDVRPGFSSRVTAYMVNPFVKFQDLELFGTIENSEGRTAAETTNRKFQHYEADGVYRFLHNQLYVGAKWNTAKGKYPGFTSDATVNRYEYAGGWFISNNLMAKAEYVEQKNEDFPATDIRHGLKFNGMMFEAVVSF